MQTIFPVLRYQDARAATDWLCAAFGFEVLFAVPETGPVVRHAQLKLGTNVIMVGSIRDDGVGSPKSTGQCTMALSVYVDDLDGHYQRARAAGAKIVAELADTDFGARMYSTVDLEGHPWTFGDYRPETR